MRRSILKPQFSRDVRRMKRRGKDLEKLIEVVRYLEQGSGIPTEFRPHKLHGEYKGCWECHIESDWVLIWIVFPGHIVLVRTGSHADLFE